MKKKPHRYNVVQNISYVLKNLWEWDRKAIMFSVIQIPAFVVLPLLNLYLPKIVLDDIERNISIEKICFHIITIVGSILLINLITKYLSSKIDLYSISNHRKYIMMLDTKLMDMDYEIAESPQGRRMYQKAQNALFDKNRVSGIINTIVQLSINIFGFIAYASIISKLSPLIVLMLLLTYGIDGLILLSVRNIEHKLKDDKATAFRRINRLVAKARDLELAKDIRLYSMLDWIKYMGDIFIKDEYRVEKTLAIRRFVAGLESAILIFARDGIVYAYLIYKLISKDASAGDVVLYLSAIFGFSSWIGGIAEYVDRLLTTSLFFCDIREFIELPDEMNRGSGCSLPEKNSAVKIEIENLSFTYPDSDKPTLKNINLTINEGEKIAIVGVNGAGKTTLIKLLCGLYSPTQGNIKVNGKNISEYNRDEYYSLFSVVFQDVRALPVTILENVSLMSKAESDIDKVKRCISQAGLEEKVYSLKHGLDSILIRGVNDGATDFSGGEMQKLMLARAIYKTAPIMILDEPTAALDPIAESEMYMQYNELSYNRTSVYISHRLASTKFCDRIILLDGSEIVEEGTHDELMSLHGIYANMFETQSQYYK